MSDQKGRQGQGTKIFNIEEIRRILPHRYPFLLVDRVIQLSDSRVTGIKNVTATEAHFQGHFPDRSVMPGVLIVEAMAQTAGVLMLVKEEYKGKMAFLVGINEARFRKTVVPGDQLKIEIEVLRAKSKVAAIKGIAYVDGEEACSAEMMFSFVD